MSYQIAICEDNKIDAQYTADLVNEWARRSGAAVRVEMFPSAESFLFAYAENKDIDILLLDIEMGAIDGVTLAKQIRNGKKIRSGEEICSGNDRLQIVFITGYPDFIAEGYEVSALHYLIKPVSYEKLSKVLDRAAANLDKREKSVLLSVDNELLRIPVSSILCVEVFSHTCVITTIHDHFEVKQSISELEKMLGNEFIRCHRSYLIGLRYIKSISKTEVTLDNGTKIPVSRSSYHAVNQAFIRYFKGVQQ